MDPPPTSQNTSAFLALGAVDRAGAKSECLTLKRALFLNLRFKMINSYSFTEGDRLLTETAN